MKISKQGDEYEEEQEDTPKKKKKNKSLFPNFEKEQKNKTSGDDADEEDDEDDEEDMNDEDADDDEEDEDDEDDDDEESYHSSSFGGNTKFIVIGVAAVVVILIGVFVVRPMLTKKSSDDTLAEEEWDDTLVDETAEVYEEPAPVETHTVREVLTTDENATILSTYGYTGSEIQLAESLGLDMATLISNSQSRQEASAREAIKKLSDTGSTAYKNLVNKTYLSQERNSDPVDQSKLPAELQINNTVIRTYNGTYEKCPTFGTQLFLKCKIFNGIYVWYPISPARWVQLPDTGSIVLDVALCQYGNGTYVTGIQEHKSDTEITSVEADVFNTTGQ